jgi:hypothetical protein
MKKVYGFHGVQIEVVSALSEIPSIFEETFGLKPLKHPETKSDIFFRFVNGDRRKAIPNAIDGSQKIRLIREKIVKGVHVSRKLWLTEGNSTVEINYRKNTANFYLDKSALKARKLYSHTLIPLALIELLKKYGFYYIHASCAEINGAGILFTGGPARGKTTACYSLIRAGANWISDDAVLLRKIGGKIRAYSFIKEFSLKTGRSSLFKELKNIAPKTNGKTDLQKSRFLLSNFRRSTTPKILVSLNNRKISAQNRKTQKRSQLMGEIIHENEFLFLDKKFTGRVIDNLEKLCHQCRLVHVSDKSEVLDSQGFKAGLLKILG